MFSKQIDQNISLTIFEIKDAGDLLNLINSNRSYLRDWLSWVDNVRKTEDTLAFIKKSRNQFAASSGFQAGIRFKQELVGVIGFHGIDWQDKKTEIGYWLDRSYQGRGIITKSCAALLNYAFYNLELNKVEIHCAAENIKSQAVPERLGFCKEGEIREAQWLYDHFVNHVIYGLLSREWKAKCPLNTEKKTSSGSRVHRR